VGGTGELRLYGAGTFAARGTVTTRAAPPRRKGIDRSFHITTSASVHCSS
jgi:hypothetical protein